MLIFNYLSKYALIKIYLQVVVFFSEALFLEPIFYDPYVKPFSN